MLKKVCLLFLIFFINLDVNALCGVEEFKILKEKAKKIDFSYDYKIVEYEERENEFVYQAIYNLTAYNLDNDLLVSVTEVNNDNEERIFKYKKNKTNTLTGYNSGRINIKIKGNTKNCDSVFRSETINLLYYNYFYNNDICKDYPLFKYCQSEFVDYDIYKKNLYVELQEYIDELESKEEILEQSFFERYSSIISVIGLILIILIILIITRFIIIFIIKRRSL